MRQRPDVRVAEANLRAANALIGVAIANRLPQITLTGNLGSSANAMSKLFSPDTGFWTIAADVVQPILNGETLANKQKAAEAARAQSAAQYRGTVLVAFQNVADTLRALQADARALNAAIAAEQSANRSIDLVRRQVEQGQVSLPALLNAQQAYLQTSLARVQAEAARLADTVALFQALGGGWWNRPKARRTERAIAAMILLPDDPAYGLCGRTPRHVRIFAALVVAMLAAGCWPFSSKEPASQPSKSGDNIRITQEQTRQLNIVPVELYLFHVQKPAIGQIAFNEDASTVVLSPFSGRVTRLIAKIGDDVKQGDPLFEIDSPEVVQAQTDLIAAVQGLGKAKSQLALAKRVLDRQTSLLADRATAQRDVDAAQNDYALAQSDLTTAEGTLTAAHNRLRVIIGRNPEEIERVERERLINPLITINAPIDGTVIARKVGPGQYVRSDAAEPLYSVANLSTMWLKANVPENDISIVHVGQEIEVKVTALPDRAFKARIIAIGSASDAATRRVVVRSEIPNPDRALKSEMFATFKIAVGEAGASPAVPTEAVIREGDLATVWIQREPLLFQRRKVKIGLEQDGRLQILDGLAEGELVIGRGAIFVDNEWRQ